MFKKLFCFSMFLCLLVGCSSFEKASNAKHKVDEINPLKNIQVTAKPDPIKVKNEDREIKYEVSLKEDSILKETEFTLDPYVYEESYGSKTCLYLITNLTDQVITFEGKLTAYDRINHKLSDGQFYSMPVGPEQTTFIRVWLGEIEVPDHILCEISAVNTTFDSYLENLSVKTYEYNNRVVSEIYNYGDKYLSTMEICSLFYDSGDRLVGMGFDYQNAILPGEATYSEIKSLTNYDHSRIILSTFVNNNDTYYYKKSAEMNLDIDATEISGSGYTQIYVKVINNSEEAIAINLHALGLDSANQPICCADSTISVLGSGETTMDCIILDQEDIHRLKILYSGAQTGDFLPLISELSYSTDVKGDSLNITIRNHSDRIAKYCQAYVIFYDKDGKAIGADSRYIGNKSSEIEANGSNSGTIRIPDQMKSYEVYLRGYSLKK